MKQYAALAEKEGFEPSLRSTRTTPLAGEPLRPLGYFSESIYLNLTKACSHYCAKPIFWRILRHALQNFLEINQLFLQIFISPNTKSAHDLSISDSVNRPKRIAISISRRFNENKIYYISAHDFFQGFFENAGILQDGSHCCFYPGEQPFQLRLNITLALAVLYQHIHQILSIVFFSKIEM